MKDIEKNNEAFKALSLVSRRIAELEAENERVKAENAKLRELCEGMLVCYEPCNTNLDARTDCPLYDDGEPLRCRKARLLRELGIGS